MEFTIRRRGGYSLVVLGPPAQVTSLDVVVEDVGDGDGRPNVAHVVRRPEGSAKQEDGNVEVGENLELLVEEVEGDGQDSAQRETPQEHIVDGARTEHLLWTEGTPGEGSLDKRDVQGAKQESNPVAGRSHLVVENGRADEGGDEGCPHLAVECDPWSDVRIVGKLETLSEVEGLRGRDVSVRLEVVHSSGVTREPEATEELGNNLQDNLDIRDGHDDTARDAKNHSEEDYRVL